MAQVFRVLLAVAVAGATVAGAGCGPSKDDAKPNPDLGPPPTIKPADRSAPGPVPPKK